MNNTLLEKLGYDTFFHEASTELLTDDFTMARVIEVNKNSYMVSDGSHEMLAELSGKFLFDAEETLDYPTVGDWVAIQALDNYTHAIVHATLPRKTILKRKESGKRVEFQLIASNIDIGLIVQSANNINRNLLDRYLVMLNEYGIEPLVIISKIDLLTSEELDAVKESLTNLGDQCQFISNNKEMGIDTLISTLVPKKTYCLLGQSGVGKSSLLNRLLGSSLLEVNTVREKDGKGRHTTVRRQLVCLESGSIFIDTPGMRELGNFDVDQGIDQTFDDFVHYAKQCRFADCSHTHEKGCAVIAAVQDGDIDEERYENFIKLKKESDYYDMSYHEKRQKDKSFGKMIKNYKKMKRNK